MQVSQSTAGQLKKLTRYLAGRLFSQTALTVHPADADNRGMNMSRPIDLIADITDEYIARHFEGTNYGHTNYRDIVGKGCLSAMAGYNNGYTTQRILINMGLTTEKLQLTKRGREFLFWHFNYQPVNGREID